MSDLQSEKRHYKRVLVARLALIASADESHSAYVEDISLNGVQLRNAESDTAFGDKFAIGDEVALEIEDMSSLSGSVVRLAEPMIAVTFPERSERENKMLVAELMDRQGIFSLDDPEAYDWDDTEPL